MKYFSKYFTARVVLLTLAMLLSSPLVTWAQGTITIKGVVKDAQKEPLAGVSIRVKGTTAGTTTTPTGDYTLQNVSTKCYPGLHLHRDEEAGGACRRAYDHRCRPRR